MNSGMGIVKWIEILYKSVKNGQPACLSSKPVMVGYDEAPETERRLVYDEGLTNLSMLKIQSGSKGNFRD